MTRKFKQISMFVIVLASLTFVPYGHAGNVDSNKIRILFIFSWHRGMPWQSEVEDGFEERLKEASLKYDLFYEYMDAGRFNGQNQVEIFNNYLSEKYAEHEIDYVIYESVAASNLFKQYPGLFIHSRKIIVNPGPVLNNFHPEPSIVIPVSADYEGAVKYLLEVNQGKKIYLIAGSTIDGKERLKQAEGIISRLAPDRKVIPLVGLPMNQLLENVSRLDSNSVIFYLLIFQDSEGTRFIPYDAAKQISQKSSVPVYSFWTSLMGSGTVGGYLLSGKMVGQELASILMHPERIQTFDFKAISYKFHGFFFDWNQLVRWHIDESTLPPGSRVLFRKPSFIEHYAHELTVCLLGSIILLSLLWNNRLKREVIERHKAEQELRESENKYRVLSEASFEGIVLSDKGKILDFNNAIARMFGYSLAEVTRMNIIDFVSPDERDAFQDRVLTGHDKPYEILGMTKYGKELPLEVHTRIFSYGGRQVRVSAIRDLTQQKEAENERKKLIKQLNKAQQVAKLGYWELNLETNTFYWSDEIYRIFDLRPQQFKATYQAFMENVHPEDRSFVNSAYIESVKNGLPCDIEHRVLLKNGEEKWVREICSTDYDKDNRPIRSIGTIHDISKDRKAQELIRITNQQLQTVLDTVDTMIYVTDIDTYEIILINKNVREHFGDITGKKCWASIQVSQDGPCDFCEVMKHHKSNSLAYGIHVWQVWNTKNGEWYECRDSIIEWIDGRDVRLTAATNISDRKKNELERERLIGKLQKALDEIKVLKGILPICSYCKKIRDDEGYWNQIEAYIQDHSDAEFSHGICHDCIKKYYPDLDIYSK